MKNYHELEARVKQLFANFERPSRITIEGPMSEEMRMIESDFGLLKREEMTQEQCSMMVVDNALIRDEAICYFLPSLAALVLEKGL